MMMTPLINAADVSRLVSHGEVVVIDARGGADARQRYEAAHLSGSLFVDLESELSAKRTDAAEGGRHPLPEPRAFSALLGKAGIRAASHVLVYDDKAGANAAARFWWMMKSAGHDKIQVVDGGLDALRAAGAPISSGASPSPKELSPYVFEQWMLPLADINTIEEARSKDDWLIIDVRENYRYRGESEPIDLVAGHIPGAVNLPYSENLQPDGKFKSPAALAETFKKAFGSADSNNIIIHCGSGVTACHSILAMEVAGLPPPRLYVGSWSEWSRNDKPIASGSSA